MLVPAISRKQDIEQLFAEVLYTQEYFNLTGGFDLKISNDFDKRQYVIIDDDNTIIGYFGYSICKETCSVSVIQLYAFKRNNMRLITDVITEFKKMIKKYRRIEWCAYEGCPAVALYDKIIQRYHGHKAHLHKEIQNLDCKNYLDVYIYEILAENIKE